MLLDFLKDPPLGFFVEDLLPFLDFFTSLLPPTPEEAGATLPPPLGAGGGFGAKVGNESAGTFFNVPLAVAPYDVVLLEIIVSLSVNE